MPHDENYSEPRLIELWRTALDPENIGLAHALAGDIASFTRESVDTVLSRMATGLQDFKKLWAAAEVNVHDSQSVKDFYKDQFVEAYELAQWHCGRTTGQVPMNYARAAAYAGEIRAEKILDFGSGIGSGSLCLSATHAEVHSADVAQHLLRLTGHRLQRRGYTPTLIDLSAGQEPKTGYYDLITCFDVLEHVPDQLATVKELQSYLKNGGRLIANFAEDSTHVDRPMHISSAGDWLRMIRATSLRPDWHASERVGIPVVERHPLARVQNLVALVLSDR